MMIKRRTPYVTQLGNMDCGIACLTMIFNYYGVRVDIVDVGSDICIGRDGVTLSKLKNISEKYGFTFNAYRYEYSKKNLEDNLPAILFSGSHYVVIERKNRANKYTIIDPAKGKIYLDFEDVCKLYSDILILIKPGSHMAKNPDRKKIDIPINIRSFILVAALMLLMQIVTLMVPVIIQRLVDSLSNGLEVHIGGVLSVIIILAISYFSLNWLRQRTVIELDTRIYKHMIAKMLNKLFKIENNFFEWHTSGEIGNRFSNISQLNDLITNGLGNVIIQSVTSIICMFAMLRISKKLTIFALGIAFIQVSLMLIINKKNLEKSKKYIYQQNIVQSELIETLENMLEIRCMGMDGELKRNLEQEYDKLLKSFKERTQISNLMNCFTMTISLIFPLALYMIGASYVSDKMMSIGTLISYVTLTGYFTSPFSSIVILLPSVNSVKEILLRYKELINFQENSADGNIIEERLYKIILNNVSYSYAGVEKRAISNISLDINKGENIAIVGLSGSGKSTLIKALLGAVQIESGEICINGIDITKISKEQIYKWFSIVTQNPICLNGTIRRNVDITGKFSDAEIWKALELAEVKEDVMEMPLGLDTRLGERGQNISGGQKQRIAIARALLSNTDAIILDEATSNLDPITEQKIYENLREIDKTRITITHRLSSIQKSDRIYVLSKGKLIESGKHEELMRCNGWYYRNSKDGNDNILSYLV